MPAASNSSSPSRPASRAAGRRPTAAELQLRRVQTEAYLDLMRIHREMERRTALLFEEVGLTDVTPAQASALIVLFQARGPMTARALALHLALSEVTVGRFVKALEEAGWVERESDPDDARAMLIRPTARAYRALPRFIQVSNALLDEAFAGFSADEVRKIARTTERLRRNIAR